LHSAGTAEVSICEVGPRDGLQNEPEVVPTAAKRELIQRLAAAGLRQIEVTSFVSPQWIPQLADAEELVRELPRLVDVRYSALVPNERGYERFRKAALAANRHDLSVHPDEKGVLDIAALFVSASETHNKKNVNCSIAESLARFRPVIERARVDGVSLRAYVSTACGCPYEGEVSVRNVVKLVQQLAELGVAVISLGDTIGVGHPRQVCELVAAVAGEVSLDRIALHLHDTYGRALANVQAGFEAGVRTFDAALGGLGGCPYAPGASGNVATEDVADLFESAGVATGIALEALVDTTNWLARDVLKRALPGRVYRARLGARKQNEAKAT